MKNLLYPLIMLLGMGFFISCSRPKTIRVASPDRRLTVELLLRDGALSYALYTGKQPLILPSKMGFSLADGTELNRNFEFLGTDTTSVHETWEQPWGESRMVTNQYNQLTCRLRERTSGRNLEVTFRLFNDGVGFRYFFPEQNPSDSLIITEEQTEFRLAGNHWTWWTPVHSENSYYESLPNHTPISIIDTANTPLTIEVNDSLFLAIHEANLTDFASMTLLRTDTASFKSDLVPWSNGVKVYATAPFHSPWRTILVGKNAGELATSHLMLNLNEPNRLTEAYWIKPGKYIGIWWGMHLEKYTWGQGPKHGATTSNTKAYIDFAADHGFSGVLVEGWNSGWDGDWTADGRNFSFTQAYPDFDLKEVAEYGHRKQVQLIGHHETAGAATHYEQQLDAAFQLYRQLGIHTVKTGYVHKYLDGKEWHDGQFGVRHYRKVIETAAQHQIMVNNHEPVKGTGLQRTFPNLMTQEGGRGQEYDAWSADGGNPPAYTTIVPFTRMLAGPFDFTPGTFNFENKARPETRVQTTLAKQLALYVVIYSPLQMASDLPENYVGNPAFRFIEEVPCDWNRTLVLNAKIGHYTTFARQDRNSRDWYVGAITNEQPRQLSIALHFLDPHQSYTATLYTDGPKAHWKSNPYPVDIQQIEVTNQTSLQLNLAPGGGTAIRITPN